MECRDEVEADWGVAVPASCCLTGEFTLAGCNVALIFFLMQEATF